jgi:GTPase SAR1 family protein
MGEAPITIKITVLGSAFVGKTSLCGQFTCNSFSTLYCPTHSFTTFHNLILIDNKLVLVQLDDLFPINHPSITDRNSYNSEIFGRIIENNLLEDDIIQDNPLYAHKNIDGILFVFDLTDKKSFELIEKLVKYVKSKEYERQSSGNGSFSTTNAYLIGNKSDLHGVTVKNVEIQRVADEFGLKYFKTSALSNRNVGKVFYSLSKAIINEKWGIDLPSQSMRHEVLVKHNPQSDILGWCDCSKRNKNLQACIIH